MSDIGIAAAFLLAALKMLAFFMAWLVLSIPLGILMGKWLCWANGSKPLPNRRHRPF